MRLKVVELSHELWERFDRIERQLCTRGSLMNDAPPAACHGWSNCTVDIRGRSPRGKRIPIQRVVRLVCAKNNRNSLLLKTVTPLTPVVPPVAKA